MNNLEVYRARIEAQGKTIRDASLKREKRFINNKIINSLSYHQVLIDGIENNVAITNKDNLNEKTIYSLPGGSLKLGGLVEWMDNRWLITDKDFNTEVYTKAIMTQCNYLLKWVGSDKQIHEQWCVIEDGTKLECVYYLCA